MKVCVEPIRSESDYEKALDIVASLMDVAPGTKEFDQIDVISTLIEAYEQKHHPVANPDPVSAIEYHMESRGLTRKDLEELLNCARGRVSEILNRKRCLTIGMMRKLNEEWGISADILLKDYAIDDAQNESIRLSSDYVVEKSIKAIAAVETLSSAASFSSGTVLKINRPVALTGR